MGLRCGPETQWLRVHVCLVSSQAVSFVPAGECKARRLLILGAHAQSAARIPPRGRASFEALLFVIDRVLLDLLCFHDAVRWRFGPRLSVRDGAAGGAAADHAAAVRDHQEGGQRARRGGGRHPPGGHSLRGTRSAWLMLLASQSREAYDFSPAPCVWRDVCITCASCVHQVCMRPGLKYRSGMS